MKSLVIYAFIGALIVAETWLGYSIYKMIKGDDENE